MDNPYSYPPRFICRRCGKKIWGDNGSGLQRLAIYCEDCADKIRARHERRARGWPPVRVVRVATGRNRWIEYRGTFPSHVFRGREIVSDNYKKL